MSSAMQAKPNGQDSASNLLLVSSAPNLPVEGGDHRLAIDPADWDVLFDAVSARLCHAVGEDLHHPPDVPACSAPLTASLIQAVVLDCVGALDQLHVALKYERSQRLTP
ncbi:MAG: hypothetical protein Q8M51_06480 [Polaromonas sp.]|nr:hypothetical protein [Polaromonas sp.]